MRCAKDLPSYAHAGSLCSSCDPCDGGTTLAVRAPPGPALETAARADRRANLNRRQQLMSQCTATHVRTALLGVIFAVPIGCVVTPVHSDDAVIAIDPVTGACTAPKYTPKAYNSGDQVQNVSKLYQCTVGGWCTIGGPYEPGVGWAWQQAWT